MGNIDRLYNYFIKSSEKQTKVKQKSELDFLDFEDKTNSEEKERDTKNIGCS